MTDGDHLIWSNYCLDYEDWRADLEAEYPELSEDERHYMMYEINDGYLDDERMNLNIQLPEPILVIADLGLWTGRHSGYKEVISGNIQDCLRSENDYSTWYVDKNGDFRCDDVHHDGINHYLYRVFREDASDAQRGELLSKIYFGTATFADIDRVTRRLGDEIGKVYGWEFSQRSGAVRQEAR